jgi:hypothetical protein
MFTHSKEVLRKGTIKYPSQVICEGDIKRLLMLLPLNINEFDV